MLFRSGQTAHRVACSVVFSYVDFALIRDIRASIRTYLQIDSWRMESYWQWLGHNRALVPNAVYMLVGSYETDVVWVRDGFPQAFERIDVGAFDAELDADGLVRAIAPIVHTWAHEGVVPPNLYLVYDEFGIQHGVHDTRLFHQSSLDVPYVQRGTTVEVDAFPTFELYEQEF